MPTARFAALIGVPERTYRRWQAKARMGGPSKGPWPTPARDAHRAVVVDLATAHPAWGHRKVWAMARHAGHRVACSTVLRILDEENLLLKADYQRERRQFAQQRKAAFAAPPTGPNMVWQLDFSEYETPTGGTCSSTAGRRYRGLLVQVRVRLALVPHREPARRDHHLQAPWRSPWPRPSGCWPAQRCWST